MQQRRLPFKLIVFGLLGSLLIPSMAAQAKNNEKWVTKQMEHLDALADCASGDAVSFPKCIPAKKKDDILERAKSADVSQQQLMMPPAPGSEWKAGSYEKMYNQVIEAKAGVCTTFGLAAAHCLTMKYRKGKWVMRDEKKRGEIVAYKNHVYVLVGRKGPAPTEQDGFVIDNAWHKQKDVIIVDPWAGAMGHKSVYKGVKPYPFKGMIDDLKLISSWPEGEK
jgi:hypothetical protein